jgi:hypothetical protein
MITLQKLKVFDNHVGDSDRLMWADLDEDIKLFEGNSDWAFINSIYHDIELIKNKLAAPSYIEQTLASLKANCDEASYDLLSAKILNAGKEPETAPDKTAGAKRRWWQWW